MANLYTYMITAMKKAPSALFVDKIHGEQELSLDQTLELFSGIRVHFEPEAEVVEMTAAEKEASFDVS